MSDFFRFWRKHKHYLSRDFIIKAKNILCTQLLKPVQRCLFNIIKFFTSFTLRAYTDLALEDGDGEDLPGVGHLVVQGGGAGRALG